MTDHHSPLPPSSLPLPSPSSVDMNRLVGTTNLALITLDTLRYDVATAAMAAGQTPNLARLLPGGWEQRHTAGSFTFAAHQAFFAGFLPTPITPGPHERPFAIRFGGSTTTGGRTCVFDTPNIVEGLAGRGYHTICIGGVGFFNPESPLGQVLPAPFAERHWSREMGVTGRDSTALQFRLAAERLAAHEGLVFLFINISALHQPNCHYLPGAAEDSPATQAAALAYVDRQLPILLAAMDAHGPWHAIICADHGTAYGEDGHVGHRIGLPVVWNVPYGEFSR